MKRIALAFFSTIAGLVMLLGFKTHSTASTSSAAAGTTTSDTNTGNNTSGATVAQPATRTTTSASSAANKSTKPTTTTTTGTKTYTGTAVNTIYGPVQVQITVTNDKITAVNTVQYPQNDPRDQQINSYAIPQLDSETVSAQSANIDMVSGATYTSTGYIQSLQSALDQAGL